MGNTVSTGADGFAAIFTSLFCLVYCLIIVVSLGLVVHWIWMLIDVIQRKDDQFGESLGKDSKVIWLILMLFTGVVASMIYYFIVYRKYPRN